MRQSLRPPSITDSGETSANQRRPKRRKKIPPIGGIKSIFERTLLPVLLPTLPSRLLLLLTWLLAAALLVAALSRLLPLLTGLFAAALLTTLPSGVLLLLAGLLLPATTLLTTLPSGLLLLLAGLLLVRILLAALVLIVLVHHCLLLGGEFPPKVQQRAERQVPSLDEKLRA